MAPPELISYQYKIPQAIISKIDKESFLNIINHPWLIGTLKYLETEIEKRRSRPCGAKQSQAGPNRTKQGQNGAKWGQTGPNGADLHAGIFLGDKNII